METFILFLNIIYKDIITVINLLNFPDLFCGIISSVITFFITIKIIKFTNFKNRVYDGLNLGKFGFVLSKDFSKNIKNSNLIRDKIISCFKEKFLKDNLLKLFEKENELSKIDFYYTYEGKKLLNKSVNNREEEIEIQEISNRIAGEDLKESCQYLVYLEYQKGIEKIKNAIDNIKDDPESLKKLNKIITDIYKGIENNKSIFMYLIPYQLLNCYHSNKKKTVSYLVFILLISVYIFSIVRLAYKC